MRIITAVLILASVVSAAYGGSEGKAPIPLEVPAKWQLNIEVQNPKPIHVRLAGDKKPTLFWYVLYTVTNRYRNPVTHKPTEQSFAPEFTLYTSTGNLLRAGKKTRGEVYDAIKKRHQNPLLKDMVSITGKLLFGHDNSKDGVAIWRDFDPKAGAIEIFIGGLSGETFDMKLPKPVDVTRTDSRGKTTTEKTDFLRLTKTYQLSYKVPGQGKARLHLPVKLVKKKWILR